MRKSRKFVSMLLVVSMMLAMSATVFATTYTSSSYISVRSTLAGSARTYIGTTHKIVNTLTSRDSGGTGNNYCKYKLQRKSGSSYTTTGTKELNLKTVGNDYTAKYTNQVSSGTFRYYLTNRYSASDPKYTQVDGFSCDQVVMSSY